MGGEDGGLGGGGLGGGGALSEGGDGGEQRVGHCVLQSRCPGCLNSKCFVSSKRLKSKCFVMQPLWHIHTAIRLFSLPQSSSAIVSMRRFIDSASSSPSNGRSSSLNRGAGLST